MFLKYTKINSRYIYVIYGTIFFTELATGHALHFQIDNKFGLLHLDHLTEFLSVVKH